MSATGFSHAAIEVTDLERTEAFYRDILGMQVAERWEADGEIMFRVGSDHFLVAQTDRQLGAGLHHIAFDTADLDAATARLEDRGINFQPVDHGAHRSIYFRDPDGHVVELCGA